MKNRTFEKKAANKNGVKRMLFVGVSILLEFLFLYMLLFRMSSDAYVTGALRILATVLVLHIYSQKKTSAIKMPWILLLLLSPVFGIFLYYLIGLNSHTKKMQRQYREVGEELMPLLPENRETQESLKALDPAAANITSYLKRNAGFPVYNDSRITYFASASDGLDAQIKALSEARSFIFMEYHAIEYKESWKRIESVLVEKVREGVDVRVYYDDLGSIGFVNTDFRDYLESKGIRCRVFNPLTPGLNLFLNNRDHRKITVIDGRVGFTGGYNLANEYFNVTHPYGMWKDSGIRIEGSAVKNLTISFLEMWDAIKNEDQGNYQKYLPDMPPVSSDSFIVPYGDNPMDDIHVGEDVYINILNKANDYCYFMTPYLILSDELVSALNEASLRGVDVRIVTPGIPDKKVVYSVTRSFYGSLVDSGIRIYEWTPGFCHAKMCVSDDKMATCGTINLDYRSLYHHFENGCFFAHSPAVMDVKKDFEKTFEE
ncbi:MAG: PLDc N-terminal domain-containing protein, partial [Spirochaetales bacterium]|nr:PLDc N-terminal domain-containing protein [Candidatus Physcosoma equi]